MSNFDRKIAKKQQIKTLKMLTGKEPKHKCKECHKMTLYNKKGACIYCSGEYEKIKEEYNSWLEKLEKSKQKEKEHAVITQ